jgi:hypothetical protein
MRGFGDHVEWLSGCDGLYGCAAIAVGIWQPKCNEATTVPLFTKYIALPAIAPAAMIDLYFTPVVLFGCVNRGLLALALVLLSTGTAVITLRLSLRARVQNPLVSSWWLISTLILILPLALVIGPLG